MRYNGGMEPVCEFCEKPLEVASTGRPRKFCSSRCRVAAHRQRKKTLDVPLELRRKDRWVRHKNKRPITVEWRPASVTNSDTWASFNDVVESKTGDGAGYVLGEGIGCIDLDGVIEDGKYTETAEWLLRECPDTWVEVSPSGKGLHVWGYLPESAGSVRVLHGQSVEVYSRDRYITVTGKRFNGAPSTLADLTDFVASMK